MTTTDVSLARRSARRDELAYAAMALGSMMLWSVRSSWLLYFYLPPSGVALVPVALYGAAIIGARVVDVVSGPLIGHWSDQTRSRWGRRRPFLWGAALPLAGLFVLLWTPPLAGSSSVWNLVYLTGVLALYNVASNAFQIPYNALLPELTEVERQRTRISAWASGFQLVGVIAAAFAGVGLDRLGYVGTAIVYAGIALIVSYPPLLMLHEAGAGAAPHPSEQPSFWRGLSLTLGNRDFRAFGIAWALYWMVTTLIQGVIPYVVTEVCRLRKGDAIYFYLLAVAASLVGYVLTNALAQRAGKRPVLIGSLLISAVVLPGLALIGPRLPWPLVIQGIVWMTVQSLAFSGVTVLTPVFMSEIVDRDAAVTGEHRAGSYYAVQALLGQVGNGVATALLPIALLVGRSQADPHGPLGVRLVSVVGCILLLAGLVVFRNYQRQSI